jgi:hypothetical protein
MRREGPGLLAADGLRTPACDAPLRWRRWFLIVLLGYTVGGAFLLNHWQHRNGQSVTSIGFGYGVLIRAIERTGAYRVVGVHYPGIAFSAHRLPLIPYFLIFLQGVTGDDLGRVAFLKSLVFNAFLGAAGLIVLARSRAPLGWVLLILGVVFTMPRWILNVFEVGLEEGYEIGVLGLLFALLWFVPPPTALGRRLAWAAGLGLLLVMLLFIKSSMLYWCVACPGLIALRGRDWRPALVALALVAAGLLALAEFNSVHAGRFTLESSWEGWNLYKGNGPYTRALYPPYSLDILDDQGKMVADRPLRDEWDYNEYFKARAVAFIRAHPGVFVELALKKAWIFYVEVRDSGLRWGEKRMGTPLAWAQLAWMLVFRAAFWWAIFDAARRLGRGEWRLPQGSVALGYLGFLVLYSGFHVVGFAYERHVMPVVLPTALYLIQGWNRPAAA